MGNNPINFVDPSGHEGGPWEWAVKTFRNWVCGGWNSKSECPVDTVIRATGILPTELPDAGEMMGPLLVDGQEAETLGQVSGAIEWGVSLASLVSQFGEVWGPNVNVGRNEGVTYTGEDLQISTGERFKDVTCGQHGEGATKYLWTVDKEGIKIAPEMTPFDTDRGNIVHTNLSPDGAFAGGELWFRSDDEIIINAGSGRYGYPRTGTPENQAEAARRYATAVKMFQELGYTVDVIPPENR